MVMAVVEAAGVVMITSKIIVVTVMRVEVVEEVAVTMVEETVTTVEEAGTTTTMASHDNAMTDGMSINQVESSADVVTTSSRIAGGM